MLSRVEALLASKRLHSELLDAGLLGGACMCALPVCLRLPCPA